MPMLAIQLANDILRDAAWSRDADDYIVGQIAAVASSHSVWLAEKVSQAIADANAQTYMLN